MERDKDDTGGENESEQEELEEQEDDILDFGQELPEDRYIFIADTKNHCIRRMELKLRNVETVAGICGSPGNEDGPLTANRLNTPEVVGVDGQGYVFIWDEGNKAVRMLDLDGVIHTMIDGACRRDLTMP